MFAITDVSGTQLPVLVTHGLLLTEAQVLLTDVLTVDGALTITMTLHLSIRSINT